MISKGVSLKLNSSETKFVWSNPKRDETCYVTSARTKTFFAPSEFPNNTEEKSLHHVATVANFLNNNKLKTSLKSEYALFQSSLILFNFISFVKCWRHFLVVNPKGPYISLEKEKGLFCVLFCYFIKRAHEIRKFHVAVVQPRLRNVQKSVMHVQSCCFANNLLLCLLFSLPSSLLKLSIVVIQKFCYHGNVTSHWPLSIGPVLLSETIFTHWNSFLSPAAEGGKMSMDWSNLFKPYYYVYKNPPQKIIYGEICGLIIPTS